MSKPNRRRCHRLTRKLQKHTRKGRRLEMRISRKANRLEKKLAKLSLV